MERRKIFISRKREKIRNKGGGGKEKEKEKEREKTHERLGTGTNSTITRKSILLGRGIVLQNLSQGKIYLSATTRFVSR